VTAGAARWLVLASALLFSTGGAAIKIGDFGAAQVSSLRSGIAAGVLAAYLVVMHGVRPTITLRLAPASVLYAASLTLFVAANKLTTAANAIFLQAVAPLYILVLGPWLLAEQWTRRDLFHVAALAAGLALCFFDQQVPSASAPDPATGNGLAAAAGVIWAGALVALRALGKAAGDRHGALSAVILGNALASLVALPAAWPFPAAPAAAWATLVYLGVFQIGLAYVLFTQAIRRVSALEASLLLLVEPVLNPLWAWLVLGEGPGLATLTGGAVIVGATALRAITDSRGKQVVAG
jgi:drug/metabolite transporter (DMT)-like permease